MIMSHKHKFIFIRPKRMATTSIEVELAKYCGEEDIITKNTIFNPCVDGDKYKRVEQNSKGFWTHMTPREIKRKVGKNVWDNYFKFSVCRNPWDIMVCRYFGIKRKKEQGGKNKKFRIKKINFTPPYNKKIRKIIRILYYKLRKINTENFENFLETIPPKFIEPNFYNTRFYFDKKGRPWDIDYFIRYENLEKDYKKLCEIINVPYKPLPRLKSKIRKDKKHYSDYYNERTKKLVGDIFREQIEYFGYKF